jgi:UDP-N-acetylglucosamine acyltransferase
MKPNIHPSAFVHPTAIVYDNVYIGEGCYIGPLCVVGAPPEHPEMNPLDYYVEERIKGDYSTMIIAGAKLFGHVTVDAGMERTTIVGSYCIMMKHSHVGHDARIGANVTIACGAKVGGHSVISNYCNLGLNSAIHQRSELAEGIMVGACAFVKGEWQAPWRIIAGVPAGDIGENKVGRARWKK